jgi:RHS repeat-associated protein
MSASNVHSNAFNFASAVQSSIDARTGQCTINISFPEVKCNFLNGPVFSPTLSYSPLNTDNNGFGLGWELKLSSYDPGTQMLSLSTGETFKVTGEVGNRLIMEEQKIISFFFYDAGPGLYRVVHKSGMIEMLHSEGGLALPQTIYSAEGHKVSLRYTDIGSGKRCLHTVTDGQGELLLQINLPKSGEDEIKVLLRPDGSPGGALARFVLKLRNSGPGIEMYQVILPTEDQASWDFQYKSINEFLCITDIKSPFGGHDTIEYAGNGHVFPGNARPQLPRVWRHISDPGLEQPPLEVRYTYNNSNLPESEFNFLGNGSDIEWSDDGRDNLYQVRDRYRYGTTETHYVDDVAVRSIERTFNRFHLLTEEKTTQGSKVHQVFTTYYADDDLDESFSGQNPQCQLPRTVETRWTEKGASRSEKVLTTYDTHGNLTEQVQANGTRETYSYFPVKGIVGECPADPAGFVRSLREKTVTPAPGHEAGAPVLRTRNRYDLMPPVQGATEDTSNDWLVLTDETLYQVDGTREQQLQRTTYQTKNDPADALRHGRRTQQTVTLIDPAPPTPTDPSEYTTTIDYAYATLNSAFVGETVLQTIETLTGFDHGVDGKHTQKTMTREDSLLHGQPLLTHDDNDVRIRYRYDLLVRVISETVSPGDSLYEAERTYSYYLSSSYNQHSWQISTDVKGVQTRTLFDGLNRVVKEQRQDKDNRTGARAEEFRDTYVARYNSMGQLEEDTEYDWCSAEDEDDLVLTSRYTYDDWGEQCSVMAPDGVVGYESTNPITQTTISWVDGTGKTQTRSNLFHKPDWVKRYAVGDEPGEPDVEPLSEQHYSYDGLGRSTREVDALSRTTKYVYDAFNRMIRTTRPDDTVVERRYAPHSSAELPIALQVTPVDATEGPVLAGTQVFDGLKRLTQLTVGPRIEKYEYTNHQLQISKRITPAGQHIDYFYAPTLTDVPIRIETPEDKLAAFSYDPKTAFLNSSSNGQGNHAFVYDSTGNLKEHRWTVDGSPWTNTYRYSLNSRPLVRKDVGDVDCQYFYEKNTGRLETLRQGYIEAEFVYDAVGRLQRTTSKDIANKTQLVTELGYDDLGREILRTLTASGHPVRTIRQSWQADERLQSRHLQAADGRSLLLEEFSYDQRGRLELYFCSGDQLPKDAYGNEMIEQLFIFDALDNITLCRTTFNDGSRDQAEYTYASDDTCQLRSVSHTHPSYPPSVEFDYDANGNMLNDEQGRQLRYDSQGRLIAVSNPHGRVVTDYRYDPHNHLFGVKNSGQSEMLRFYQNERLSDTMQDGTHTQYLYSQGYPLAQQQPDDSGQSLLLMTDGKHSVIGETQQSVLRTDTYSAYGARKSNSPLKSRLAFNGEVCEEITQWYLLGNGYRAYNPGLMRFHSPDSLSPFGAGGLNPYMYCVGDPINFSDPTGHIISTGNMGLDHILFGTLEMVFGVVTMNPVAIVAGATEAVAGAGLLSSDTNAEKETHARIAQGAQMVGLLSAVAKYAAKQLVVKVGPPRTYAKGVAMTRQYDTYSVLESEPRFHRGRSGPTQTRTIESVFDTSESVSRRSSVAADIGTMSRKPSLADSIASTSSKNSLANAGHDAAALEDRVSVITDAQIQTIQDLPVQAPRTPVPDNFVNREDMARMYEAVRNIQKNKYKYPTSNRVAPPGHGVFGMGTIRAY